MITSATSIYIKNAHLIPVAGAYFAPHWLILANERTRNLPHGMFWSSPQVIVLDLYGNRVVYADAIHIGEAALAHPAIATCYAWAESNGRRLHFVAGNVTTSSHETRAFVTVLQENRAAGQSAGNEDPVIACTRLLSPSGYTGLRDVERVDVSSMRIRYLSDDGAPQDQDVEVELAGTVTRSSGGHDTWRVWVPLVQLLSDSPSVTVKAWAYVAIASKANTGRLGNTELVRAVEAPNGHTLMAGTLTDNSGKRRPWALDVLDTQVYSSCRALLTCRLASVAALPAGPEMRSDAKYVLVGNVDADSPRKAPVALSLSVDQSGQIHHLCGAQLDVAPSSDIWTLRDVIATSSDGALAVGSITPPQGNLPCGQADADTEKLVETDLYVLLDAQNAQLNMLDVWACAVSGCRTGGTAQNLRLAITEDLATVCVLSANDCRPQNRLKPIPGQGIPKPILDLRPKTAGETRSNVGALTLDSPFHCDVVPALVDCMDPKPQTLPKLSAVDVGTCWAHTDEFELTLSVIASRAIRMAPSNTPGAEVPLVIQPMC